MSVRIALVTLGVYLSGRSIALDSPSDKESNDASASLPESSTSSGYVATVPTSSTCGIWLAPSTIPRAGLGMYAGRDFKERETLQDGGDVVVPIVDIFVHADETDKEPWAFLWSEYTWDGYGLRMGSEGLFDTIAASPGFGSAANCFLAIINVDESIPTHDPAGLHRSKDPGTGAFTQYHGRLSSARLGIDAGSELFVSYGDNWFETRPVMATAPLTNGVSLVFSSTPVLSMMFLPVWLQPLTACLRTQILTVLQVLQSNSSTYAINTELRGR
jgi:hypothetical protein